MSDDTLQYLVLDRCDPTCNMARYYALAIEPSLFGDASLIRKWGRIG
jgi:predicted DNA-binding WGR domain protein